MKQPFAYCALKYLLLWSQSERALHNAMQGDLEAKDLRRAMHHFRIARSFKGIQSPQAAERVMSALKDVGENQALPPIERVEKLAAVFKADFNKSNLSAASKLLWLRYRHPFVIFDANANAALKLRGHNYVQFTSVWRSEFCKHESEILDAVEQLSVVQPFMPAEFDSTAWVDAMAREPWFAERVFDIYLWELGSKS